MNIIIAGCGRVGYTLADQLSREGNEITVIDTNYKALESVTSECDVIGYEGDCTSFRVLKKIDADKADLLIAATDQDEKNMLACLIARKVGKCRTIARVRSPQYSEEISYLKEELGLSMSVNPEYAAAAEMVRLIQVPSAFEVDTFAKGNVNLISFVIPEGSPGSGRAIMDIRQKLGINTLICVVQRGSKITIPGGDFVLRENDKVSVSLSLKDANTVFEAFGVKVKKIRNVLIAGGGTVGYYLASMLLKLRINVKIIEKDPERCEELSELLPGAMIINGDATDTTILNEESIENMDAVCSLTNKDEENILLSLYANRVAKAKLMTRIHRNSYEDIIMDVPVGTIISTKKITAEYITRYVRSMQNAFENDVEALYRIMDDKVEALEFKVGQRTDLAGKKLKNLSIIPNTLISAIFRHGQVIRPGGNDEIMAGDSVVVVTTKEGLGKIEDILG